MSPHLSLDLVADVRQLLAFPFMVNALEAGTIVAVLAALVGWFVVLRRESFAAHTLAMMSFPGASAAALAGVPLVAGYFVFCVGAALAIGAGAGAGPGRGARRATGEAGAVIGSVQAAALALGFLFLSLYHGVLESLESLLFGSILGVTRGQVLTLLLVAVATLAVLVALGRPLLFASIDGDVAAAAGVPVRALSLAFGLLLSLAVAEVAQITGVLLVFALLVAPAATAQQLTPRVGAGLLVSVVLALLTVWLGLSLSYFTNEAVGFWVSTIALALYVLARLVAPLRAFAGRADPAID